MHAIVFGAKRAFHGALRFTRKPLLSLGLTAARFDLLSALLANWEFEGFPMPMWQSDLRRMLGVSASVVSRMLRSLEALGLVERVPACDDFRQREVSLTERGLTCIRDARSALLRAMRRIVCAAVCFGRPQDWLIHLETLEGYLSALSEVFGDRATLFYSWGHPDD